MSPDRSAAAIKAAQSTGSVRSDPSYRIDRYDVAAWTLRHWRVIVVAAFAVGMLLLRSIADSMPF